MQNNFAAYQDYALVGTKGYTFEGPFYLDGRGRILGWDEKSEAHAKKLVAREMTRLRDSFEQAREAGYRKFVMFLHYPPTSILEETSPFTEIAKEYHVTAVVYSHCHGESRFGDSIRESAGASGTCWCREITWASGQRRCCLKERGRLCEQWK